MLTIFLADQVDGYLSWKFGLWLDFLVAVLKTLSLTRYSGMMINCTNVVGGASPTAGKFLQKKKKKR